MDTKNKFLIVALVGAVVGFLLGPQAPLGNALWPPLEPSHYGVPTSAQLGLLMTYGLLASVAFGIGIAFLLFGRGSLQRPGVSPRLAVAAHLAIVWGLVSWVPHDALHQHISTLSALIALEYAFHLTLILCASVLAWFFHVAMSGNAAAAPAPAAAEA